MEAPPPYMPPRKKTNTGLIVGLIIGGVVLCCIGPILLIVGGGYWFVNKALPIASCSMAFEDARDAIRDYSRDHNGNLPPAQNWQEEVRPYYDKIVSGQKKDRGPIKSMSSEGAWGCEDGSGGKTGMAYNDEVAGKNLDDVEKQDSVILFEIRQATANAHENYTPKSDAEAPQLFGKPRGWFLVRANGDVSLINHGRESHVNTGARVQTGE